jgi:hypothetical protein
MYRHIKVFLHSDMKFYGLLRMFGPTRDEITGVWRRHNEELYALCSSSSVIRVTESRRVS